MIKLSINAFEAMARELGKATDTELIQVTETRTGTCVGKHCFTAVFSNGLTMTVMSQTAEVNDILFSPRPHRRCGTPKDSISVEEFLGEQAIPEQLSDKLLNTYKENIEKDRNETESEYDKKIGELAEAYKIANAKEKVKGCLVTLTEDIKQKKPALADLHAIWIADQPVSKYDAISLSMKPHCGIGGVWLFPTHEQMTAMVELSDELHLYDCTDYFYAADNEIKAGRFDKYGANRSEIGQWNRLVLCLKEPRADSCQVTEFNECRPDKEGHLEISDESLRSNINGIRQVMGLPSFYGSHISATANGLADALKDAATLLEQGWEYATDDDLTDLWKYRSELGLERILENEMFWRREILEGRRLPTSPLSCILNGMSRSLFDPSCCASILFVKR